MKKRLFSLFVVLAMVLTMVPTAAFAAEESVVEDVPMTEETAEESVVGDAPMTEEEIAEMMAGLQNGEDMPVLTIEDVPDDVQMPMAQMVMPQKAMASGGYTAPVTNPATYFVTHDNENNAGTGTADDDIDVVTAAYNGNHPIELSLQIPVGKLPTQTAYLAVRSFDVDSVAGEYDRLYVNGHFSGVATGLDGQWNTVFYPIPVGILKEGKNIVKIQICHLTGGSSASDFGKENPSGLVPNSINWVTAVDWAQLVCDGGSKKSISTYDIELTDFSVSESEIHLQAAVEIASSDASETYSVEFNVVNPKGVIVGAYNLNDVKSSPNLDATIAMPADSSSGEYTLVSLLKNAQEEVVASDEEPFLYTQATQTVAIPPAMSHSLSISTMTNQDVTITLAVEDAKENTEITWEDLTVSANGKYEISVSYNRGGKPYTMVYTAYVSNIDKTAPTASYKMAYVGESDTEEQIKQAILGNITAEDAHGIASTEITLKSDTGFTAKITDGVGNVTTIDDAYTVLNAPLQFTLKAPTGSGTNYTFSATLESSEGKNITQSGFVWGTMDYPTTEVNNGKWASGGALKAGETIQHSRTDIVQGMTYFVRAYIVADGNVYYSDREDFGVPATGYGNISVKNNGDNTFTVTYSVPAGEVTAPQTVYYRTQNGSAVGGTHFTHKAGALTFNGASSQTVTISGINANATYDGKASTAYTKDTTKRTFSLEVYRVVGGAVIQTSSATQTMSNDKHVGANIYTANQKVQLQGTTTQWIAQNSSHTWTFKHPTVITGNTGYIGGLTNLRATATYTMTLENEADGRAMQKAVPVVVTAPNGTTYSYDGPKAGKGATVTRVSVATTWSDLSGGNFSLKISTGDNGGDMWKGPDNTGVYISNVFAQTTLNDDKEPQVLGLAPVASSNYKSGDTLYLSVIFDEIVDTSDTKLMVDSSQFSYHTGKGTNVLCFKGQVTEAMLDGFSVSFSDSSTIKDMCSTAGTATSESVGSGSLSGGSSTTPVITISGTSTTGNVAKATVSATNANTVKYQFTNSTVMPVTWLPTTSGSQVTFPEGASKTVYLHVLAQNNTHGTMAHTVHTFTFPSGEIPPAPIQPTITATVGDQSQWAKSRTITIAKTPDTATVTWTAPDGTSGTLSGNTFSANQNGMYTFTATQGELSYAAKVVVEKLDAIAPTATIVGGNTESIYNTLLLGIDAEDGLSGVQSVQYAFTDTTATPATWSTATKAGERYSASYTATESALTDKYLHIKVLDVAGNEYHGCSDAYQVIKAPTDAEKPQITLTSSAGAAWSKDPITLSWSVTGGTAPYRVIDGSGTSKTDATGTIVATQNGKYTVVVQDANGYSAEASLVLNTIDVEEPFTTFAPQETDWASSATVGFVNPTDDRTPQFDAYGTITGYDGSGIVQKEYKHETDAGYTTIGTESFTVTKNGTYTVKLTDAVGNTSKQNHVISNIDSTAPTITEVAGNPTAWQKSDVTLTINGATDAHVGLHTAPYSFDDGETWQSGNTKTYAVNHDGIVIKVRDALGNIYTHDSIDITKIDKTDPVATITTPSSDMWKNSDVTVSVSVTDENLEKWEYTLDGSTWKLGAGTSFVVNTNGAYTAVKIHATDAVGNTTTSDAITVKLDKAAPTTTLTAGTYNSISNTFTPTDGLSGIASVTAGGTTLTADVSGTYTLPVGESMDVVITDTAGNTTTITGVTVKADVTVTFDANSGTTGTLASSTVPYDTKVTPPTTAQQPTKTGYTFTNWKTTAAGDAAFDFDSAITANTTAYASWTLDAPNAVAINGTTSGTYQHGATVITLEAKPTHAATSVSTYSYQWYQGNAEVSGANSAILTLSTVAESDSYTVKVTASDGTLTSTTTKDATATVTIHPYAVTVPTATQLVYNAAEQTALRDGTYYTVSDNKGTNAGSSYSAKATLTDKANYVWDLTTDSSDDQTIAWSIAKAPVTFAVTNNSYTYDEGSHTATVTQTINETPSIGNAFTVTYGSDDTAQKTTVGTYDIYVEITDSNFKHSTSDSAKIDIGADLTINKETVSVTPTASAITYGQTLADSTLSGTATATTNSGTTVTGSFTWDDNTVAPQVSDSTTTTYDWKFTPTDGNYATKTGTVTLVVNPKAITITAEAQEVEYGTEISQAITNVTDTNGDLVGVDSITAITLTASSDQVVGDKTITPSGATITGASYGEGNYAITYATGTLTITAKELTITDATATNFAYNGGTTVAVSGGALSGNLQGDDVILSDASATGAVADKNVDTDKAVTVSGYTISGTDASNYTLTQPTDVVVTIAQKSVTAVWTGTTTVYTGSAQSPSVSLTGAVDGDTVNIATVDDATTAGNHTITATLRGTDASNYTITNPTTSFTISKAPVTFAVTDNVVEYTGRSKTATVTPDERVNYTISYQNSEGETVVSPSDRGTYSIYATINDTNYRHATTASGAALQIGTLTIYTAVPTVYTVTFGDSTPGLSGIAGTIHTLPTGSHLDADNLFAGWSYNNVTYKAGDLFIQPSSNVTMTAVYQSVYDITGTVEQVVTDSTGAPLDNVVVTLMAGSRQIAQTTTATVDGIAGTYSFSGVPAGTYNIVATYDGVTRTSIVTITDSDVRIDTITLPAGITNSIVEVAAGTPDVVVGGLDEIFEGASNAVYTATDATTVSAGGSVELILTAEEVTTTVSETTKSNIEAEVTNLGTYLDIKIIKTVTEFDGTVSTNRETVSEVPDVLTFVIPIPAEYQNKASYSIYREHDYGSGAVVEQITTTENGAGEKIEVNSDKTCITLYAKHFSTYALAYTLPSTGASSYTSGVATAENGTVTVSGNRNKLNSTVTITPTPNEGYEVGDVTVTYASGREVTVTDNGDGTYSYKQPGASVTITVTFEEIGSKSDDFFVDAGEDDWFYDSVKWAVENGVTSGTTTTTFSPYDITTRGQTVTFLWRSMEMPEAEGDNPFDDVMPNLYYSEAVLWAVNNGITLGTTDTTFSPHMDCSRAHIITFLWRMMGKNVVETENPFTDVNENNYYYNAVAWAVSEGITSGTTATTFSPDKDCTRAEIVTFLYRALAD